MKIERKHWMQPSVSNILNVFSSIDLKEIEEATLMNRMEVKYSFNIAQLPPLLNQLSAHYSVVEVVGKKLCEYNTLYYDNEQFSLYHQHHNGELNRYKVRHRTYVESNTGFLEVKFKNNKGRSVKERINEKEVPYEWQKKHVDFLNTMVTFAPGILQPVVWVNYKRITLVHKNSLERVTIDLDIEFVQGTQQKSMDVLVMAEVKQDKKKDSPFIQLMKKSHIREGSLSKYCMAICYSYDHVKKNAFKKNLNNIKKLLYDASAANSY